MARMTRFYPLLIVSALLALIVGYGEGLVSVIAQGGSAVYERLSVLGEVRLTDNQIQEAEMDIDNVPTDGLFLKWDNGAGKLMWGEVGFDTGDWSNPPGTSLALNCPDTPGDPGVIGERGRSLSQNSNTATAVMSTQLRPVLSYDVTFREINPLSGNLIVAMYLFEIDSGRMLIFSQSGGNPPITMRVTGVTAPLPSGPIALRLTNNENMVLCEKISSVSMVPM